MSVYVIGTDGGRFDGTKRGNINNRPYGKVGEGPIQGTRAVSVRPNPAQLLPGHH
jgi:hypothetical protein